MNGPATPGPPAAWRSPLPVLRCGEAGDHDSALADTALATRPAAVGVQRVEATTGGHVAAVLGTERRLERLLATLRPERRPGEFVFVCLEDNASEGLEPHATVREAEGLTVVLDRGQADARRLSYDFVAAWITLSAHSALDAVGLTAAVARRLAAADISCNVLAGVFHDHLLVPANRADDVLELLRERDR